MKRILRIEIIFISQYLKRILEYRIDFLIGFIGVIISQALNIIFLTVLFSQIPLLQGWNFSQLIFIYGFSLLPKGLDHLFCDNLWSVGDHLINKGDFDKYLTRPLNPLFHILAETFQVDAFGELITGLVLFFSVCNGIGIHWDLTKIVVIIIIIPFAASIYTSIKIITSSLAFWIRRSGNITYVFYMMSDFAKYPTTIYNIFIKWTISFVVPFAFTAYYPANYFLTGRSLFFNIGGLILASIVFIILSMLIWNRGIKAYESAGT